MYKRTITALLAAAALFLTLSFQKPATEAAQENLIEGFRLVEVASVADAMEQLYGKRAYMSHDMRPLAATKFAGPAVTVLLKKDEHRDEIPRAGRRRGGWQYPGYASDHEAAVSGLQPGHCPFDHSEPLPLRR